MSDLSAVDMCFAPIDYFIHLNINILNKFFRFFLCFFHYFCLPFTLLHTYTPIFCIQCLNWNAQNCVAINCKLRKFPHLPTDRKRCNRSNCLVAFPFFAPFFFCSICVVFSLHLYEYHNNNNQTHADHHLNSHIENHIKCAPIMQFRKTNDFKTKKLKNEENYRFIKKHILYFCVCVKSSVENCIIM